MGPTTLCTDLARVRFDLWVCVDPGPHCTHGLFKPALTEPISSFKSFVTLSNGDERSRLVPVLNTILKLSPEETQKLQNVAKGSDPSARGWTGLLWS
uniref:GRIP domain-containing protein n=1 Tax=Anopheles stephensi TaxID=30069 RepID=A0A182YLI9_ANOST